MRIAVGIALLLFYTTACQSVTSNIGISPGDCCPTANERPYSSFRSQAIDMPEFLEPLMLTNFNQAFANKGLYPLSANADLEVSLRLIRDDLDIAAPLDDFEGHIAPGGKSRYIAQVIVEMRESDTGKLVWNGSVQRLHDVDVGEFMHTGRASRAILAAFERLLEDYDLIIPAQVF